MLASTELIDRPGWQHHAACKGKSALFWPAFSEDPGARDRREAQALAVCAQCPVIDECCAWARARREPGIWGGETHAMRAANGYAPVVPGEHLERQRRRDAIAALTVDQLEALVRQGDPRP